MQPTAEAVGQKWETSQPQRGERAFSRTLFSPRCRRVKGPYFTTAFFCSNCAICCLIKSAPAPLGVYVKQFFKCANAPA